MSLQVVVARNPMDPETWELHDGVADVHALLRREFAEWPAGARIYHGAVSEEADVTPHDEESALALARLEGRLFVICHPRGPLAIILAIVAVIAVVAIALLLQAPTAFVNNQVQSPNNDLSDRTNKPRPGGRVPDIYGQLRATPDLLTSTYKVFRSINGSDREVEVAYMCVGRGSYDVLDVRDDVTPLDQIQGSSAAVYGPNTSPLLGSTPQVSVGATITDPVATAKAIGSVNGQTLDPPGNAVSFYTAYTFNAATGQITASDVSVGRRDDGGTYYQGIDWSSLTSVGATVRIAVGASYNGGTSVNLSGSYRVTAISGSTITVESPATVNAAWTTVAGWSGSTAYAQGTSSSGSDGWQGPFVVDLLGTNQIVTNFVCTQGVYKQDGNNQYASSVNVVLEVGPCDRYGNLTGAASLFYATVTGSSSNKEQRATTVRATLPFSTSSTVYCRVRARRTTPKDTSFNGTVVDEVKWRDAYAMAPLPAMHFGDVTTVQTVTLGTTGALGLKQRKLNMLVTRRLPLRVGSTSTFTSDLHATTSGADIFCAVALDPKIGNRPVSQLDVAGVYAAYASLVDYFGTPEAGRFAYTFDKSDATAEQTLAAIAQASCCQALRRGSLITVQFEKPVGTSRLLLNHRNKVPKTEARTVSFGVSEGYDGVAFNYVSPADDSPIVLYVPQGDGSALKARKVDSVGVRSDLQAHMLAWRVWNRLRYQHTTVEFDAHQEADLLTISDRVTVADNTRSSTQDGEVLDVYGTVLTLSQPVALTATENVMVFQQPDGTVQALAVTAWTGDTLQPGAANKVVLASVPQWTFVTGDDRYARTTYVITDSAGKEAQPFLVAEKTPQSNHSVHLKCVNYDARYYANDADYKSGLIDGSGYWVATGSTVPPS